MKLSTASHNHFYIDFSPTGTEILWIVSYSNLVFSALVLDVKGDQQMLIHSHFFLFLLFLLSSLLLTS